MWPVPDIQVSLPQHLRASEDTNFLVIRCLLCGWNVWFSAAGATLEELKKAADGHRQCAAGALSEAKPGTRRVKRFTPMQRKEGAANRPLVDAASCCAGHGMQRPQLHRPL